MDHPDTVRRIVRRADLCWFGGVAAALALVAWELEADPEARTELPLVNVSVDRDAAVPLFVTAFTLCGFGYGAAVARRRDLTAVVADGRIVWELLTPSPATMGMWPSRFLAAILPLVPPFLLLRYSGGGADAAEAALVVAVFGGGFVAAAVQEVMSSSDRARPADHESRRVSPALVRFPAMPGDTRSD